METARAVAQLAHHQEELSTEHDVTDEEPRLGVLSVTAA